MLGETVAHAAISLVSVHAVYEQVQCYPPFQQLHSNLRDFSNGVGHAMKVTIKYN